MKKLYLTLVALAVLGLTAAHPAVAQTNLAGVNPHYWGSNIFGLEVVYQDTTIVICQDYDGMLYLFDAENEMSLLFQAAIDDQEVAPANVPVDSSSDTPPSGYDPNAIAGGVVGGAAAIGS